MEMAAVRDRTATVFAPLDCKEGQDRVTGFAAGFDVIDLSAAGGTAPKRLAIPFDGTDTVIACGGSAIRLEAFGPGLIAEDIIFA